MDEKIYSARENLKKDLESSMGMKVVFENELERVVTMFFESNFTQGAPAYTKTLLAEIRLMMSDFDPIEKATLVFTDLSGSEEMCDFLGEMINLDGEYDKRYQELTEHDFITELRAERERRWNEKQKGKDEEEGVVI
jgi:hypothetical protein